MTGLTFLYLLSAGILSADVASNDQLTTLRYVKQEGAKLVPEAEIIERPTKNGTELISRTFRGDQVNVIKLSFDKNGKLVKGGDCIEDDQGNIRSSIRSTDGAFQVPRPGGLNEYFSLENNPVVTSAPDWSDIIQLVRRYDREKAGKQEFPGLWIRPNMVPQRLTFSIERGGSDTLVAKGAKVPLERYRIRLRSGRELGQ
jgi:hypothetical protein